MYSMMIDDAAISCERLVGSSLLQFSGFKHKRSDSHDNQSDLQEGRQKEENLVQGRLYSWAILTKVHSFSVNIRIVYWTFYREAEHFPFWAKNVAQK